MIYLKLVWKLNNYFSKLNCVSVKKNEYKFELLDKAREALIAVTA